MTNPGDIDDTPISAPTMQHTNLCDYEQTHSIAKLTIALALAQGEMENTEKDASNPHYHSAYSTLAAVRNAVRKPLSKHGIAVTQFPITANGAVGIVTQLSCEGEWMRSVVWGTPQQEGPQAIVAMATYLRRCALSGATGVAPEDDDGEAASGRGAPPPPAPRIAPRAPSKPVAASSAPAAPVAPPASPAAADELFVLICDLLKTEDPLKVKQWVSGMLGRAIKKPSDMTASEIKTLAQRAMNGEMPAGSV